MSASISLWIDELIERSSFGTPSARALRNRTSDEEVAVVDRLLDRSGDELIRTREFGAQLHTESHESCTHDRSNA